MRILHPLLPAVPRPGAAVRGFTLVELMVVVAILAGMLLLVPPNLYRYGARSRLENSANTIVALIASAREQAIQDGQTVKLEFGVYEDEDGEVHHGHRIIFTNTPVERSELLDEGRDTGEKKERPDQLEWLETMWHDLSGGVVYSGVSERFGQWKKLARDRGYVISFTPDGGVEKGFAIRLESEDLEEVKKEMRTITIKVNPLTAEAGSIDGMAEMTQTREENEFQK